MKKLTLPIFVFLCFTQLMYAQTNQCINMPNFTPVSPNAASMSIYADYPVSYYTGVPDISVPLYEIDVDGYKLPISLSYHASGIEVSQEASWVGLGWTLNVGGNISRSIKGYDDFLEDKRGYEISVPSMGYYDDKKLLPSIEQYINTDFNYYFGMSDQGCFDPSVLCPFLKIDVEPDVFFYSIPGASGKFLLNKSGGATLFDVSNNIKVEVLLNASERYHKHYFRITTTDGTQYTFKDIEISRLCSATQRVNPINNTTLDYPENKLLLNGAVSPKSHTSNWYLSEIITPQKQVITFTYEPEFIDAPTQVTVVKYDILTAEGGSCGPNNIAEYAVSKVLYDGLRLSEINWNGGKISFIASNRDDLFTNLKREDSTPTENEKPKKLDKIEIRDKSNNFIKGFAFTYEYFNPTASGTYAYVLKRLKLKNVMEYANVTATNKLNSGHSFYYYEDFSLPVKNSLNTDFWGYYNSSYYGDASYPAYYYNNTVYSGADRSSNYNYLRTGTLNKIVYPTGDSTQFDYEENSYSNSYISVNIPDQYTSMLYVAHPSVASEYDPNIYYPASKIDTVETMAATSITVAVNMFNYSGREDPNFRYYDGALIGRLYSWNPATGNKTIKYQWEMPRLFVINQYGNNANFPDNDRGDGEEYYATKLTFQVYANSAYIFEAYTPPKDVKVLWTLQGLGMVKYADKDKGNIEKKGGGLRIQSIKTGDKIRTFKYYDGKLLHDPVFAFISGRTCLTVIHVGTFLSIQGDWTRYLVRNSQSITPMSSFNYGNAVGYGRVEEYTNGGMISNKFYNTVEPQMDDGSRYPWLPFNINYYNGLSENKIIHKYNSQQKQYIPVKRIDFTYDYISVPEIRSFILENATGIAHPYSYNIKLMYKNLETTNEIFDDESVSTTENFGYNSYHQLSTIQKTVNSNNYTTKYYYATDKTDDVSKSMVNSFMIGLPVEIEKQKNNTFLQSEITSYKDWNNNIFAPEYVKLKTWPQTDFETRIAYYNYDKHGNPLYFTKDNSDKTVYLWSYNYQYPIAKIENATYDEMKSALGYTSDAQVESLSAQSNPDVNLIDSQLRVYFKDKISFVTTYTYKPLVGMTSATDPQGITTYYDYDSFGRLKETYYYENNDPSKKRTVESYDYHYKN